METKDAYNKWAGSYDEVENKTRDLEAIALKKVLGNSRFDHILELGSGTGKNTGWLAGISRQLTAVDFSEEMIQVARQKHVLPNVSFKQADLTHPWDFFKADLITCSLVLEHIQNLDHIFKQAFTALNQGGQFYICELHPYKQLQGSRAKFESDGNIIQLEYFVHHLSDYFQSATQHGFACIDLQEWFDKEEPAGIAGIPRLCSFLFEKKL